LFLHKRGGISSKIKKIKNFNKTRKRELPTSLTALLTPMVFKIRGGEQSQSEEKYKFNFAFSHRKIPNHQSSKECIKGAKSVENTSFQGFVKI